MNDFYKNKTHIRIKNEKIPDLPGVYLFKKTESSTKVSPSMTVLYIGKAKSLKKRISSYFKYGIKGSPSTGDLKTQSLIESSTDLDFIVTKNEVEALLLEARLIQNYQPKYNVLLKSGQPYVYLTFSTGSHLPRGTLPQLKLVRNKKGYNPAQKNRPTEKVSPSTKRSSQLFFGPFLEKSHAKKVYNFLIKTFRLKICNKKIPNGCLHFHLGLCAGTCKEDFDKKGYLYRLNLAKKVLQDNFLNFLKYLEKEIKKENLSCNFEKSQELYSYHKSFEKISASLDTDFSSKEKLLTYKHVWILIPQKKLFLFKEKDGVTKKCAAFDLSKKTEVGTISTSTNHIDYFKHYYHNHVAPQLILTNFSIEDKTTHEEYLYKWQQEQFFSTNQYPITITTNPKNDFLHNIVKLAHTHAKAELQVPSKISEIPEKKQDEQTLKKLLEISFEPETIDCFDISHKQGFYTTGSSIRFTKKENTFVPDKNNFRKFKIKLAQKKNDYACLQEIVSRRYKNRQNFPDIILIDGGKGQLSAIEKLFVKSDSEKIPHICSLAKKEETIFAKNIPNGKKLDIKTTAGRTLIALRDYAHHFAVSYHKKLERTKMFEQNK